MTNFKIKVIAGSSKLLILMAIVCLCSAATLVPNEADFSGIWKINTAKSVFEDAPLYIAPKQLKVSQDANAISIERFNMNDDLSYIETAPFSSKTIQSKTTRNRTKTASMKWSDDGQVFTETATFSEENNPNQEAMKLTETWRLAKDGQTLTADMAFEVGEDTKYSVKVVYDKTK